MLALAFNVQLAGLDTYWPLDSGLFVNTTEPLSPENYTHMVQGDAINYLMWAAACEKYGLLKPPSIKPFSAHSEQPKEYLGVSMSCFKQVRHRRGYIDFYLRKAAMRLFLKRKGGVLTYTTKA